MLEKTNKVNILLNIHVHIYKSCSLKKKNGVKNTTTNNRRFNLLVSEWDFFIDNLRLNLVL